MLIGRPIQVSPQLGNVEHRRRRHRLDVDLERERRDSIAVNLLSEQLASVNAVDDPAKFARGDQLVAEQSRCKAHFLHREGTTVRHRGNHPTRHIGRGHLELNHQVPSDRKRIRDEVRIVWHGNGEIGEYSITHRPGDLGGLLEARTDLCNSLVGARTDDGIVRGRFDDPAPGHPEVRGMVSRRPERGESLGLTHRALSLSHQLLERATDRKHTWKNVAPSVTAQFTAHDCEPVGVAVSRQVVLEGANLNREGLGVVLPHPEHQIRMRRHMIGADHSENRVIPVAHARGGAIRTQRIRNLRWNGQQIKGAAVTVEEILDAHE